MNDYNAKLEDFRRSIIGFVSSDFPNAIIQEKGTSIYIGYQKEKPRVKITAGESRQHFIVQITRDLKKQIRKDNSIEYILNTKEDFSAIRFGISIILALKTFELETVKLDVSPLAELPEGYSYRVNNNMDVLEILSPQENTEQEPEIQEIITDGRVVYEDGSIPSIARFFDR